MSVLESEQQKKLREVDEKAKQLSEQEAGLEIGYAHLGWMILEVAEMQYWRLKHNTFRDYLKAVAKKSQKTPGQLHQYFLTVRDLSDTFTLDQMEKMGISKAIKLRNAKDYAIILPQAVINAALDPLVKLADLKKVISVALKMPEEDEGDWMDLEFEFMVTPEQRLVLEAAEAAARRSEPFTKSTIALSQQKLDIAVKWAMEYLGSHSPEGDK